MPVFLVSAGQAGATSPAAPSGPLVQEIAECLAGLVYVNAVQKGASSRAIGGPIVSFDMRDFYLKDLLLIGCTAWDEPVFPNLVSYIETGEIRPLLAGIFPLARIADAQREFLRKRHIGNFVLIP